MSKIRFICKKINASSKLASELTAYQKACKEKELSVTLDIEIRWNSTFEMLNKAIKIKKSLTAISKDLNDEKLIGSFYDLELQKVDELGETFEIDQIIRTKIVNKKKQYFVSWKGYPNSFNSWVPESDIVST